ncbi:hypothetical protein E0L11_25110 [Escherichia coli]|jgi:hypothetical protein|uniref:hypothetical protein n=1 Tax=Enterobacteriaceae TaxID=543 RepID=UPI0004A0BFCC|nr:MULTISPECIES: hypothetical protein [Enterobacteriaceae]EAB8815130.1 hypothetical protein [Salmonella enterica subsp. enterica serovar Enteritidis]EBK0301488.1 hypothetical protein [Salmonella enterica]EBW5211007.1 hypothetical protein [Salmonella enterica subsp. enterica serovar Chester]EBY0568630.1 hypothetical protein [Salmonella enterica subsp. enterica serovar Java]EBY2674805.1 hypothetical protein [Salmonella enterica subsp. enterica serovar Schwarzengrund]EEH6281088.1 hypothetical pr
MKASTKENLKLTWAVICVAISVIAGMVYWHYFQPGDGASMKHAWNAWISTFGVTGGTGVILFCISGIARAFKNA